MPIAEDESDQEPEQFYSGFLIRLVSVCGVRTMASNVGLYKLLVTCQVELFGLYILGVGRLLPLPLKQ